MIAYRQLNFPRGGHFTEFCPPVTLLISLFPRLFCASACKIDTAGLGGTHPPPPSTLTASLSPRFASVVCRVWAQSEVWQEIQDTETSKSGWFLLSSRNHARGDSETYSGISTHFHRHRAKALFSHERSESSSVKVELGR